MPGSGSGSGVTSGSGSGSEKSSISSASGIRMHTLATFACLALAACNALLQSF